MKPAEGRRTLDRILELVGDRTGLTFHSARGAELRASVERSMKALDASSPDAYLERLESDPAALNTLLTELTVGESFFFREPGQLEFIRTQVIPHFQRRGIGDGVRVWSAGCATGEETYTLAILLHEMQAAGSEKVLGTDLSPDRIARAQRARYREWSLRGVPDHVVARYFRHRGGWYHLVPQVRRLAGFRTLNLVDPDADVPPAGEMDLVLCRNVLIYLDRDSVAKIARRLIDALAEDGWLFLGAADPQLGGLVDCETVVTGAGVAYRRLRQRHAGAAAPPAGRRADGADRASGAAHHPGATALRDARTERKLTRAGRRDGASRPAARRSRGADAVGAAAGAVAGTAAPAAAQDPTAAGAAAGAVADGLDAELQAAVAAIWSLANRGRLRQAELACEEALRRWPARGDLLSVKAIVLSASGQPGAAAAAARQALYLDPQLVTAHLALGEALFAAGHLTGAATALRNAERRLGELPQDAVLPTTSGETVEELMALTRLRLRLLSEQRS